ncbi:3-isopropylmalate dehydratase small subunit [Geodia barretti]|uniref:3-isopropylmalate dehydratase n=1 Tax=Geodia barretti TaxID=519541 RepID=A0AA35TRP3_GEOBA|nr:3-isopropylmalate dehydratase small subunit [Geodia barretti]
MEPFVQLEGVVAPLDAVNVDTDMIIPAIYLKSIERTGFGPHLFDRYRYNEDGSENPDFILNQDAYRSSRILVSGPNFGCGSSREHAPWALDDFGIRCVIAPSFADIFFNNCFKNGLLPLTLPETDVRRIMDKAKDNPGFQIMVDLEAQQVRDADEEIVLDFEVDEFRRYCLLNGLDDIGLSLQHEDAISAYESRQG